MYFSCCVIVGDVVQVSSSSDDSKIAWYTGIGPRVLDLYAGEMFGVSR